MVLTFEINRTLLWVVLLSKRKLFPETSYLDVSYSLLVFPLAILVCLLTRHKPAKQSVHQDSKDSHLPEYYSRTINGENAPKEKVQSFIDLVNMAKWLIDENQQPCVTQELGRLYSPV